MALEIERRFLVKDSYAPTNPASGTAMRACYLVAEGGTTVRVRQEADRAVMTLKKRNSAIERAEFEYEIPYADALYIMDHFPRAGEIVEKIRYTENIGGREWVVDIFSGANAPLRIAEVELESADAVIVVPEWAGEEITGDDAYSNAALALHPYSSISSS